VRVVSRGQGKLAGKIVRIGHMGPTASSMYPVAGLAVVGRTFADLGVSVKVGDGLDAALEILSQTAVGVA